MKTILITDDSFVMRNWIKKIILKNDYIIVEAVNGMDAIEKIEEMDIDLVILDLLMPEYDGYFLLKEIEKRKIDIKTMVLSADIQKSTKDKVMSYNVDAFLNKPPEVDELLNKIENLLT